MIVMDLDTLYRPGFKKICQDHGISMAILFGSQATGKAIEGSDLDLAVWLEKPDLLSGSPEVSRARRHMLRDFINYLGTGNIDLVILNHASPILKFQVARGGKPVYQKEAGIFAGFCSRALREHNDARIFYRETEEYLQKVIKRRGKGG